MDDITFGIILILVGMLLWLLSAWIISRDEEKEALFSIVWMTGLGLVAAGYAAFIPYQDLKDLQMAGLGVILMSFAMGVSYTMMQIFKKD